MTQVAMGFLVTHSLTTLSSGFYIMKLIGAIMCIYIYMYTCVGGLSTSDALLTAGYTYVLGQFNWLITRMFPS